MDGRELIAATDLSSRSTHDLGGPIEPGSEHIVDLEAYHTQIQRLKIATKACHIPMLTLARVNVMIQVFINAIIVAAESIGINDSHTVAVLAMINGTCKSVEYIFNFEHKAECLKQILRNIHELEHDVKLLQIHQKHPECHDLIRQDIQKFNTHFAHVVKMADMGFHLGLPHPEDHASDEAIANEGDSTSSIHSPVAGSVEGEAVDPHVVDRIRLFESEMETLQQTVGRCHVPLRWMARGITSIQILGSALVTLIVFFAHNWFPAWEAHPLTAPGSGSGSFNGGDYLDPNNTGGRIVIYTGISMGLCKAFEAKFKFEHRAECLDKGMEKIKAMEKDLANMKIHKDPARLEEDIANFKRHFAEAQKDLSAAV